MQQLRRWIVLLISLLAFVSCATTVPDVEVCLDKGPTARCTTTISKQVREPEAWDVERVGRLSVSPSGWEQLKVFILKVCERTACNRKKLEDELERGTKGR